MQPPAQSEPVPAGPGRRMRLRIPGFTSLEEEYTRDAPAVATAELNERRDAVTAAALPMLSAAIGVMLLLSSFFRLQPLDTAPRLVGAGLSGLVGAGLVVAAIVLARREPDAIASIHAASLVVIVIGALTLCVAMVAMGTLAHTTYVELLLVVAGPVLLRPGWYAAGLGAIWALWLGVAAALSGSTDASGWVLAMLAATVVSVVLHTMRTDTLRALGRALMSAEAQAVRDPLSGLLNRRGLAVVGEEVLALAKRAREPLSCTFVDIDGLKDVNDAHGHETGDAVIVAVAEALLTVFREADVVARWGGDEFVVLAMGAGPRVEDLERRLEQRLGGTAVAEDGSWLPLVSCGRVVHMPYQDETLDQITERADQEMYRRRRLRRAQVADGGFVA